MLAVVQRSIALRAYCPAECASLSGGQHGRRSGRSPIDTWIRLRRRLDTRAVDPGAARQRRTRRRNVGWALVWGFGVSQVLPWGPGFLPYLVVFAAGADKTRG
jgi:hypothetical protein